jgi:hypothetical protein
MIWETSSVGLTTIISMDGSKLSGQKLAKILTELSWIDRSWVVDVAEFERRRGGHPGGSEG